MGKARRRGDQRSPTTARCWCADRCCSGEYYKRPDATAESIDADGYFQTGDAGLFDADGHLKIIDRAKDVGKLWRAMFAPTTSRTS